MTQHPAKAAGCAMSDEELVTLAREFREGILDGRSSDGLCAYVCLPLGGLLRFYGVECQEVETDLTHLDDCEAANHIWIRLADGGVLDPTIDQFGEVYPDVYLGIPLGIHGAAL